MGIWEKEEMGYGGRKRWVDGRKQKCVDMRM